MWQSRLSFAVGFLLAGGSLIAVADSEIHEPRTRQPLVLSVEDFVNLLREDELALDNAGAQTQAVTQDPTTVKSPASAQSTGDRPVLSFSLVEFARQAAAQEGAPRRTLKVSLVDLVTEKAAVVGAVPDSADVGALPDRLSQTAETRQAAYIGPEKHQAAPRFHLVLPPASGDEASETVASRDSDAAQVKNVESSSQLQETTGRHGSAPAPQDAAVLRPPSPQLDAKGDDLFLARRPTTAPSGGAAPDVANDLHLVDAVRSALNAHPAIAESLSRLDQQQELVNVARAGYLPQLRSGINTGYRHSTGRSEEAFTVSASQMLYDFGKVSSAVDAAVHGVDREQAGVLLAAEDLIRETAQAFIEARRYEVLLDLATEQVAAIADLEALAAKRSAMGASTASDQFQAKSRREAARATQLQMQAQRDQWHRTLEKLIGSRHTVTLNEGYPETLEALCQRLPEDFDSAPRVVMAEAERAEAEAVIQQARAELRPTLSLSADFEHYLNRDNERLQQLDDQEFVVSLNLTSNLFQGGALRARSRAADHALRSAAAARDTALLDLSRLYRETRARARSLTASLTMQDERHDSIVKTQELYRHQYLSLGTRTLLDILNTEQEIFQTRVDKQNTLFDLRRLQIDCLYSVGGLREAFRTGDALTRTAEVRP